MHAAAPGIDGSLVPTLIAIAVALLGAGGIAGVVTALATRRNYVTGGFRDLTDASAKEAADERALRERAEYMRDRWREAYYGVRDEAAAKGITLMTRPPTEHPSEGKP
jgi:hypothetical protein